jgi:5'-nucleotidase
MSKLILVTNDDGIHSDGLEALAEALAPLGRVVVVAPDREKSASSHALTLHRPVALKRVSSDRYMVDGTPADCVYLGALKVLPRKPDLIASGINRGGNIGDDVTYSGTVAAAIEGAILGIPSYAMSQIGFESFDFARSAEVAHDVAERILDEGLPEDVFLNVNVPGGEPRGVRCTRQGKHLYDQVVHETRDPRGRKYFWVGSGEAAHMEQSGDTDYTSVKEGFVSVTPLHLDLTHRGFLGHLREQWQAGLDERVATRSETVANGSGTE